MRLTAKEQGAIKQAAREVFGSGVIVRVFGSRLDDDRRGGDIDLHVQVANRVEGARASALFRRLLDQRVGERDYDILIAEFGRFDRPVDRRAIGEGVVL